MNTNWQIKKLGEICDIINGSTPLRNNKDFWDHGDIPWFTIDDIREQGRVTKYTKQKITKKTFSKTSVRLLPPESVLLCCTASVGEYAITKISLTTNQQFNGLVIKDKKLLDPSFLFYFSSTLKDQLLRLSGKTTIDFIPISRLKGIEIPFPPLSEQHRIVKILDEVLGKIEKAKENTEKNLQNSKDLFESYLQNVFTNPGKNWKEKKIGEVCKVIAGQSPEGRFYNDKREGLPFYQGKKEFSEKFIGEPTTWTTEITKEAEKDDILMSVRAPVGPINFATQKICIGRGLAAIRAGKEIDKDFLFYNLLSKQKKIIGNAGAVFASINKANIESLVILLPSLSEQKAIVAKLDALSEKTKKLEAIYKQKLADLEELKKSVLKKAFNGEL